MKNYYYHLRCGGKLIFIGLDEAVDFYSCEQCGQRGYPLVETWVDDEDRREDADLFELLPTTFTIEDKTVVVCALIPNVEDGNRWINDLLNAARKRDEERARR